MILQSGVDHGGGAAKEQNGTKNGANRPVLAPPAELVFRCQSLNRGDLGDPAGRGKPGQERNHGTTEESREQALPVQNGESLTPSVSKVGNPARYGRKNHACQYPNHRRNGSNQ